MTPNKFCPHCGKDTSPETCRQCGTPLFQGQLFCAGCGSETEFSKSLSKQAKAEITPETSKPTPVEVVSDTPSSDQPPHPGIQKEENICAKDITVLENTNEELSLNEDVGPDDQPKLTKITVDMSLDQVEYLSVEAMAENQKADEFLTDLLTIELDQLDTPSLPVIKMDKEKHTKRKSYNVPEDLVQEINKSPDQILLCIPASSSPFWTGPEPNQGTGYLLILKRACMKACSCPGLR